MYEGSSLEIDSHERKKSNKATLVVLGATALPAVMIIALAIMGTLSFVAPMTILVSMISLFVAQWVIILGYCFVSRENFFELYKVKRIPLRHILLSLGVGIGGFVALQLVSLVFSLIGLQLSSSGTSEIIGASSGWERWIILLLLTPILVPITEEFLFRGVIYNYLQRGLKKNATIIAWVVSSVLFGLSHAGDTGLTGVVVVIWTGLFGALLVWLYRKSDSIWSPILAHSAYNAVTLLIMLLTEVS